MRRAGFGLDLPHMRPSATPLLVLALLALGGCKRADTPVKAYKTFHDHVRKGEYKQAYAACPRPPAKR